MHRTCFSAAILAGLLFNSPFQAFYALQNGEIAPGYRELYFNRYDPAVERFKAELKDLPASIAARVGLAVTHRERGLFDALLYRDTLRVGQRFFADVLFNDRLAAAAKRGPLPAVARLNAGVYAALAGERKGAIEHFSAFLAHPGTATDAEVARARAWKKALEGHEPGTAGDAAVPGTRWLVQTGVAPAVLPANLLALPPASPWRDLLAALEAPQPDATVLEELLAGLDAARPSATVALTDEVATRLYDPTRLALLAAAHLALSEAYFGAAYRSIMSIDGVSAELRRAVANDYGLSRLLRGRNTQALEILEPLTDLVAATRRALAYVRVGRKDDARGQLHVALRVGNPIALTDAAQALSELGEEQKALEQLDRALRLVAEARSDAPEFADKYGQVVAHKAIRFHLTAGRLDQARALLDTYRKAQREGSPEYNVPSFLLDRAQLGFRSGLREFPATMGIYRRLTESYPEARPIAEMFQSIYTALAAYSGDAPVLSLQWTPRSKRRSSSFGSPHYAS